MPHSTDQVPEIATYPVPSRLLDPKQCPTPHVNSMEQYRAMWKESVEQPDKFFGNVSDFDASFF
jgi:acetyl-CoA synthetase